MARVISSGTAEISSIRLDEQTLTPTTPAAGYSAIFAKSDGLYIVDDAGAVTGPFVEAAVTSAAETKSVACNAQLNLTVAEQDVSNLTIAYTPAVNESVFVTSTLYMDTDGCTAGDLVVGKLYVNAAAQTPLIVCYAPNAVRIEGSYTQTWVVALTGGVAYTIKIAAYNTAHAAGHIYADHSTLSIIVALGAL